MNKEIPVRCRHKKHNWVYQQSPYWAEDTHRWCRGCRLVHKWRQYEDRWYKIMS